MTYQTAFPDYDNSEAAESLLALGWKDESWHNDVCPSFTKARCAIFVDYLDTDKREIAETPVCTVIVIGDDGSYSEVSQSFDSIPAAILFADEVNSELSGESTIADAVKWVRFRLQLSTLDEATALLADEREAIAPCAETIEYLESVIHAFNGVN